MADFDKKAGSYPIKTLSKAVKETQRKRPVTNADDADAGGDPKNGTKQDKVVQVVDPRQFVVINPPMQGEKNAMMMEARSQSKVDYLIRLGLGDMDRLSYYRQALMDPKKANQVPYLRKYVAESFDLILDIIFEDAQMYNRVRTKLQANLPQGGVRAGVTKIEDAVEDPRGVGTDALTKKYADMTPGQSFELIKKALKGNKKND